MHIINTKNIDFSSGRFYVNQEELDRLFSIPIEQLLEEANSNIYLLYSNGTLYITNFNIYNIRCLIENNKIMGEFNLEKFDLEKSIKVYMLWQKHLIENDNIGNLKLEVENKIKEKLSSISLELSTQQYSPLSFFYIMLVFGVQILEQITSIDHIIISSTTLSIHDEVSSSDIDDKAMNLLICEISPKNNQELVYNYIKSLVFKKNITNEAIIRQLQEEYNVNIYLQSLDKKSGYHDIMSKNSKYIRKQCRRVF